MENPKEQEEEEMIHTLGGVLLDEEEEEEEEARVDGAMRNLELWERDRETERQRDEPFAKLVPIVPNNYTNGPSGLALLY